MSSKRIAIGASPRIRRPEAWIRQGEGADINDLYTARLTLDVTPALRAASRSRPSQEHRWPNCCAPCWSESSRRRHHECKHSRGPGCAAVFASTLAGRAGSMPLTRVALAYVDKRINLYLRAGNPARTIQLDRWRRSAVFLPVRLLPYPLGVQ